MKKAILILNILLSATVFAQTGQDVIESTIVTSTTSATIGELIILQSTHANISHTEEDRFNIYLYIQYPYGAMSQTQNYFETFNLGETRTINWAVPTPVIGTYRMRACIGFPLLDHNYFDYCTAEIVVNVEEAIAPSFDFISTLSQVPNQTESGKSLILTSTHTNKGNLSTDRYNLVLYVRTPTGATSMTSNYFDEFSVGETKNNSWALNFLQGPGIYGVRSCVILPELKHDFFLYCSQEQTIEVLESSTSEEKKDSTNTETKNQGRDKSLGKRDKK